MDLLSPARCALVTDCGAMRGGRFAMWFSSSRFLFGRVYVPTGAAGIGWARALKGQEAVEAEQLNRLGLSVLLHPGKNDFTAMYVQLGEVVRFIGIRIGRVPSHESSDFVQNVFEKAWENRASFRGDSALEKWLIGFAYNTAKNRRKAFRPLFGKIEPDDLTSTVHLSPEERVALGEEEALLNRVLDGLTYDELVLFLTYWGVDFPMSHSCPKERGQSLECAGTFWGKLLSVSETARVLNVNRDIVERQLKSLLGKMAKRLGRLGLKGVKRPRT